ncbi:DNA polymerase III subunit delta' C-terminal domain-containing protein [Agarivorans sp. MS3-6]|uniref:DNA polymerase III subunit delta' C-terminal domain-containing protein n=1 Tax=Agarivorans sp. TSD2052 TaxID=2937286 RepID=UPI00200C7A83|nr:DNA polymerase III subunit delta' C-terminal domain-containing protein [Agarivorans sp. TSD2052]UPW20593.1 hypothetical protein M0C34_10175 [Agarivorans sp. TSD2052]
MSLPWLGYTWKTLSKQLHEQNFPQSVLLRGEQGLGKQQLARFLAKTILCSTQQHQACNQCHSCQIFEAGTHGGFFQISQDKPKVDDIRELSRWAGQTSSLGSSKVAIISDISLLNDASNNALLKTLEEPVNDTHFILINHLPFKAMPTILSRCQVVNIKTPSIEMAEQWLLKQKIRLDQNFSLIYRFCNSSPLRVLEFYREQQFSELELFIEQFQLMTQGKINKLADILQKDTQKLSWLSHTLALAISLQAGLVRPSLYPQLQTESLSVDCLNGCYRELISLKKQLEEFPSLNISLQLYPIFSQFKD